MNTPDYGIYPPGYAEGIYNNHPEIQQNATVNNLETERLGAGQVPVNEKADYLDSLISYLLKEVERLVDRVQNLIVFGMPELQYDNSESRIAADRDQTLSLLEKPDVLLCPPG
ncbi:hypothetical protein JTB14_028382 [Gonioctena quinquepunctata]|nr:hypothetical protein JTB14_028382 [Gonioctena quinquepunctata]